MPPQTSGPPKGRVPIPRMKVEAKARKHRAARACEGCRQRKVKCDGGQPTCLQCRDLNIPCLYSEVKRVRDQKRLEHFMRKADRLERALQKLSTEVEDEALSKRIRKALKDHDSQDRDPLAPAERDDSNADDSDSLASSVGSLHDVDRVREDLNRDPASRATGFMGKNSEITWMQRLKSEAEQRGPGGSESPVHTGPSLLQDPGDRSKNTLASTSYHLDDLDIRMPRGLDPFAMPPRERADLLFHAYMDTVHPSFPVIRRSTFTAQYNRFFNMPSQHPGRRWLAILNMIFAIGSRHCQLIHTLGSDADDQMYLNRARQLSLNGDTFLDHADLQQVQLEALVAFYLMAVGQINRAWTVSCIAARSSVTLGINLRSVDNQTPFASKEARCRVWWSIYILENLLNTITGRAAFLSEGVFSVDLPLPIPEERLEEPEIKRLAQTRSFQETYLRGTVRESEQQMRVNADWMRKIEPSPDLYFCYLVDISRITQAVLTNIYSADIINESWPTIEKRIITYNGKLDSWLEKLHECFQFNVNPQYLRTMSFARERIGLALTYYGARITANRPCLTRPSGEGSTGFKWHKSRFGNESASRCLDSALSLICVLPEEPDTMWLYQLSPWWSALHCVMHSTTVLLLYLSAESLPIGDRVDDEHTLRAKVLMGVKRALHWLYEMAKTQIASRRAFEFCDSFIRRVAPSMNLDIRDLPTTASLPPLAIAFPYEHHLHHPWSPNSSTLSQRTPSAIPPLSSDGTTTTEPTPTSQPGLGSAPPLMRTLSPDTMPGLSSENTLPPMWEEPMPKEELPSMANLTNSQQFNIGSVDHMGRNVFGLSEFPYDSFTQAYMQSLFPNVHSPYWEMEPEFPNV